MIRYSTSQTISFNDKYKVDFIRKLPVNNRLCTELIDDSKYLQLTFQDFFSFLITLLNKNNLILNYLLENLDISVEDLLILRKPKDLHVLIILISDILCNISHTSNFLNIDSHNISLYLINILRDKKFFILMKNLYNMTIIQYNIPTFNNNFILVSQGNNNFVNLDYQLYAIDINHTIHYQRSENLKLINFYQYYVAFTSDYSSLKNVNIRLIKKIKELEMKLKLKSNSYSTINCRICSKLEENLKIMTEKYNNIIKNYSNSQKEKERMVMKYATSEKRVIETQRCVKLTEKKYQDALKENTVLHQRIQKAHDSIVKLTGEINSKSSEISQLRNEIEHYKNNDNLKELQLKWTQNKLKFITDSHKDTQTKLNGSLIKTSELTNECEQLRSQIKDIIKKVQKIEENKATILDQQLKEQQARIILERHIAEDSESSRVKLQKEFDLLLEKLLFADNENNLLTTKIQTLEKECADYKSKWNILNLSNEKEKAEVKILKNELSQMEILNTQLDSQKKLICTMEIELKRLYIEKSEFQIDIEAYRQHEMQMLEFTQKLTDKNVQLQCELTNIQSKAHHLENNQKPLNKAINNFITEIKGLEYNLASEKMKRIQECNMLAKYIAEQAFDNQKLFHRLEDIEGENVILRKRYDLTIREMTRELHSYHSKLKRVDLLISNPSHKNIEYNTTLLNTDTIDIPLTLNERNEKYKIYDSILAKEKLLNQIIKLQNINVKRAEKLDFLEEHSRVLLQELQKKTKIIQDYNLHNM